MTPKNKTEGRAWVIWLALGFLAALIFGITLSYRHPTESPPGSQQTTSNSTLNSGANSGANSATGASVTPSISPAPHVAVIKETPVPEIVLNQETKNLILNCTKGADGLRGVNKPDDFKTLDEYWQKAFTPHESGEPKVQVQFRNAHVRTPSGEVLRLNLSPPENGTENGTESASSTDKMTLKLFSTGNDGLPTPLELPPEWQGLEWKDALARFEGKGEVVFYEVSESERWDENTSATVLREDGKIVQAQLFFGKSSLGCARGPDLNTPSIKCSCL
jgi:hypothetical protein